MEIKKLSIYLGILFLSLAPLIAMAEIVSIGDGNVLNQGLPIEPVARYSYSQQLFLSSEIGAGGVISRLDFSYNVGSAFFFEGNRQLKLWLGHTSRSSISGWIPTDSLQLVYDGFLSESDFSSPLPGEGWLQINLAFPFSYNGLDNLLLAADENSYEYGSTADDFLCTDCGQQYSIQFQSASINPDPNALPDTGFTLKTHRSNLRIEIAAVHYTPVQPFPANQADQVSIDTDLSWVSQCDSFDVRMGTDPDSLIYLAQAITGNQWQLQAPLEYNRDYFWQVVGHYAGDSYPSALWSFRTIADYISPPRNLSAVYHSPVVQLMWQPPTQGMAHYYRVYRNSALLMSVLDPAYNDSELQPGQTYFYYITAVSLWESESSPSNLASVTIPTAPDAILQQGFEACSSFSGIIPGWQNLDLDASLTWSWDNIDFLHEGEAMGWLCFAPGDTNPPIDGIFPASGSKMAMAMSALNPPNSDWLISPAIHLGNTATLSFKARSLTADYGWERLKVLISTTASDPPSFTVISDGPYLEVPDIWTDYSIDLSAWSGQRVYLAWQCVSLDAFALFVDDIQLSSAGGWVTAQDEVIPAAKIFCYPNPSRGFFELHSPSKAPLSVQLYDLKGRKLYSADKLSGFSSHFLHKSLASGIYFLRITQNGHTKTLKQVIIR